MSQFRCVISDKKGKRSEIIREAPTKRELAVTLSESGVFLISSEIIEERELQKEKKRFSRSVILGFTEIMASLLNAGLTVRDSLELCASITPDAKTADLSRGLSRGVVRGVPFHQTLKIYGSTFSPLYQALVRLGEKTGSVARVFSRMSAYLRTEKRIRRKIWNALLYPIVVLFTTVIGCAAIAFYIMPQMTAIFSSLSVGGGGLETEIERLYNSMFVSGIFTATIITAGIFIYVLYKTSDRSALKIDRTLLFIPVFGSFIRSLQTLDFSFAMEMLTGSGITVGNALRESAEVAGNRAYREAIMAVYSSLLKGNPLSGAFADKKEFPGYVGTWIAVGERTGTVEKVFSQIRDYFQSDVEHGSERMMGLLEPGLILIIGVIVILLIVQFVLPVFSLYGRII
jgi:type II secretory pathway component PulF